MLIMRMLDLFTRLLELPKTRRVTLLGEHPLPTLLPAVLVGFMLGLKLDCSRVWGSSTARLGSGFRLSSGEYHTVHTCLRTKFTY
jgi:hypothetical protein